MTVKTEKVTHIHKELANLSKTAFEYKKLLLLKSPQNKAASTSATTEKKKIDIIYQVVAFWQKFMDFTDETVKYFIRWWWQWQMRIKFDGYT